jgi:hypothetical protein
MIMHNLNQPNLTLKNYCESINWVTMSFFDEADLTQIDVAALFALVVKPNPGKVFSAKIAVVRHWMI